MRKFLLPLMLLIPISASAQSGGQHPQHASMPMDHGHHVMIRGGSHASQHQMTQAPAQPGQDAFAAIQEIVQILEADPRTDWSKVDIDALRRHLVDMSNVTLAAQVKTESLDGGIRYIVTGAGPVVGSVQRMITAHAATMNGYTGWQFRSTNVEGGAALEVRVPESDAAKLKALGFIGVMTRGMHHQEHHLMIARGEHPHG